MINLIYYRHNLQQAQAEMPCNVISFEELTLVFSGSLNYKVNGVSVPLQAGDAIYTKNGSERFREPLKATNYVSFNFLSDENFEFPTLLKNGLSETIQNIVQAFDNIYHYTFDLNDERFNLLLSCILKQLKKQCEIQAESPLVYKIKNFVRVNLANKITLKDISEQTHYSVPHCEMIFKQATGSSIMAYVIKKRIETAKSLLLEDSLSLPEIADAVGFSDYNYFSRAFKKEVGVSPLVYRNTYFL